MEYLGNNNILNNNKIGFLSSRKCPAEVVLKSYDWAKQQRAEGNCIVCGNHSQIEKDVFEILLKGNQPLIMVLARGLKQRWDKPIHQAILEKRLLIISPFKKNILRITRDTAETRNRKIIELSDKIVVGYKSNNGQLDNLLVNQSYLSL
jgi:predicted Rossmann fold nucleotide-binding protein DprA/Smf involved in DNA uptake